MDAHIPFRWSKDLVVVWTRRPSRSYGRGASSLLTTPTATQSRYQFRWKLGFGSTICELPLSPSSIAPEIGPCFSLRSFFASAAPIGIHLRTSKNAKLPPIHAFLLTYSKLPKLRT